MVKYIYSFAFISIVSLLVWGCSPDEEPAIDPDLLPYIESFIFEANERDVNLSIDSLGITVQFENIPDDAVIGRCRRDDNGVNQAIAIDPVFWKLSTELEKEYVMFHELGHCVLNRSHTTVSGPNNICLSIMEPGTGEMCTSNYNDTTRPELLDELFEF